MEWHKGDVRIIWIGCPVTTLEWSTPLGLHGRCGGRMHQLSNKWHKKKKKVTLHMLTHGAMRGCGLTSLTVCINDKFHDIRERNVTIRSEIWTMNIHSLGFWDIRECMTFQGLILRSLGYMWFWCGSENGCQKDMSFKREWTTCSKYDNHSKFNSEHN